MTAQPRANEDGYVTYGPRRKNGPTDIYEEGIILWSDYSRSYHRNEGPAVYHAPNEKHYFFVEGVELTEEQWVKRRV